MKNRKNCFFAGNTKSYNHVGGVTRHTRDTQRYTHDLIEPWCAAWFLLSKSARTTEQSAAVGLKRGSNMLLGQTPGQTDRLRS